MNDSVVFQTSNAQVSKESQHISSVDISQWVNLSALTERWTDYHQSGLTDIMTFIITFLYSHHSALVCGQFKKGM